MCILIHLHFFCRQNISPKWMKGGLCCYHPEFCYSILGHSCGVPQNIIHGNFEGNHIQCSGVVWGDGGEEA